jgi:hypothetical protein
VEILLDKLPILFWLNRVLSVPLPTSWPPGRREASGGK